MCLKYAGVVSIASSMIDWWPWAILVVRVAACIRTPSPYTLTKNARQPWYTSYILQARKGIDLSSPVIMTDRMARTSTDQGLPLNSAWIENNFWHNLENAPLLSDHGSDVDPSTPVSPTFNERINSIAQEPLTPLTKILLVLGLILLLTSSVRPNHALIILCLRV